MMQQVLTLIEMNRINYIDCTSLGDLYDYRQGLRKWDRSLWWLAFSDTPWTLERWLPNHYKYCEKFSGNDDRAIV